ncbi:malto-oligosyltrehalose trehalohydrolase [Pedobacter sp. Leaf216]|uniref:malto-oligosyltrehalose trehalohydrolase n=1 Tax=Pedobacter sp. Leaf216 TaxID=1735684 RepID=UPI0006F9370D|nr:malto-oligosyltrehalose trehalohydrolase [Pedobacter sp. Leaf216]KQM78474.1 malto-oligosyltrehalose trehalohydrolase [Pedobacter sp. Leaf216]
MENDILKRNIGVNFNGGETAEIQLWAPSASQVGIVLSADNRVLAMQQTGRGYWHLETDQLKPGDGYLFQLLQKNENDQQETLKLADPASLYQANGVGGNSTAFDLKAFKWTDAAWKGISLKDFIIYELHTGTFTPQGDLKSIETKLDHLIELGITAIEIMPLAQFPGNRNWGYDGVYPFAVQHSYGGPLALQQLVNTCHEKGLAVILDVVYNHIGPEGNHLGQFGPYFTDKYATPWGKAINFDDAGCDGVRNYFIENALMWFRDFHIDALRLDAVHALRDFGPEHILKEIKNKVLDLSRATGRDHRLIVELDLNDNRFINPTHQCGYGMDAQWIDEFHHALRVSAGQEKNGYYADFDGVGSLAKSYNDAYVYDGQYSAHRDKKFGAPATGNAGAQFVVFSQNHDQVGNRMLGERSATLVSFEMLKLMAGAVFCSPFIPLLFMGEEWAETNPFLFFTSHEGPELAEAVRKGRKAEFAYFHNGDETPDPQSEETFLQSKADWAKIEKLQHNTMLNYYKKLITLRKTHPALSVLDRGATHAQAFQEQNCILLTRGEDENKILCILNFSQQKQDLTIGGSLDNWSLILDSSAVEWGGPGTTSSENITEGKFISPPESIVIITQKHV